MNILHWGDGFWPRIGGIETLTVQFIKKMQQRGHRYLVLAQKDKSTWLDEETYQDIQIRRLDFDTAIVKQQFFLIKEINKTVQNILHSFKPDVIHLHTAHGASALIFFMLRKLFNVPILLTAHGHYQCPQNSEIFPLAKMVLTAPDYISCVSNSVMQVIKEHSPELQHKMCFIHNSLDFPDIAPKPLPFDPPILLCLGRLTFEKGFDTAIKAMSLIIKEFPSAKLIIAGEGIEKQSLINLVNELQLNSCVSFTGRINAEEIYHLINDATAVLMPSTFEAFGLVALETGFLKRPLIGSNTGGIAEIVIDQETGLLVPPGDEHKWYDAIKSLFNNPEYAVNLGEKARQHIDESFQFSSFLDNYEKIYKDLCKDHV